MLDRAEAASLVFQFPERQLFAETVADDVAYGLGQSGVARSEVRARVEQALEDVGLPATEFGARAPFHLSGGEMRRVALAGALEQQRGLLLLDEPTLGLDAEGVARLVTILGRMHGRGVAYCVASHDADFVAATCTTLVVLDGGRVAFQGAADDFWRDPALVDRCGVRLRPTTVIGRDTVSAMQAGILYGYAGLVDGIVERMKRELGADAKVVATGGLAELVAPETKTITEVRADLTLQGLRILYERNR